MGLDWQVLERRWQRAWSEARIFEADPKTGVKKFLITVAYPYPNSPQHVGHGRTFGLTDAYARFKRMCGFNVLFPMAFHYTGTPVLAMSKRVASGDAKLIQEFTSIYQVPPATVKTFTDPLKIAGYFHQEIKDGMKEIGYSIDWRREFTTIDPGYSRFIEWQFNKLRSKGLVKIGSHPVGWCPSCESPMGQHDTKGDVDPEIGELTLIKFRNHRSVMPTATLRPETVFGVTNIWVNPEAEYVRARVEGEIWIISRACFEKLNFLNYETSILNTVKGKDLVGKSVKNPVTGYDTPVLPTSFVDPKNATGVVMSVPGHAPYDYVALEELKKRPEALSKYGLSADDICELSPISVIALEGFSKTPAADMIRRFNIQGEKDAKLEDATKELYSTEFHKGRMRAGMGRYGGMIVSEARDSVKADLLRDGLAKTMFELLNRPVYCRCGAECAVKIFEDQWFIDYGDEEWKDSARRCLASMEIVPDIMRLEFENVIDWLKEKACARKHGLGTRLPWAQEWIIESLSDSVIYMAYYTIAKHIKDHQVSDGLSDSVFDYVFLEEGHPESIARETGIDEGLLKRMRDEFIYFYPLDSRNSGRDLVPNHLTFFVFEHAAIFPEELWPRQIAVNGSVLMEGKKMSKSFGNILPLRDAIKRYGADPFRIAVLATAELLQDVDFSGSLAEALKQRLERLHGSAIELAKTKPHMGDISLEAIDRWMLSRLQTRVRAVTEAMNSLRMREAVHEALYMLDQDVQWYLRRASKGSSRNRIDISSKVLREVMETRILMLAPFTPHLCEEIWHMIGKQSLIATEEWPEYDDSKVDVEVVKNEEFIKTVLGDTTNILRATGLKPTRVSYYTCSPWKWEMYLWTLESARKGKVSIGDLMRRLMTEPEMRVKAKEASKFAREIIEDINKMPSDLLDSRLKEELIDEFKVLRDAQEFYKTIFKADISIYQEEDSDRYDPLDRARFAQPHRPAIYIE